jgi:hypothetical protein
LATGIQTVSAQSLGTGQSMELAHDELGRVAAAGVSVVCMDNSIYPTQLKQIYDPRLVLYVRGNVYTITQPGVAIVGTRHPTPYGLGMAERLACDLAVRRAGLFSRPGSQRRRCRPSRRHQRQRENGGGGYYLSQENTRLAEQMLALAP